MWRGGCRSNISVAASFVWRCLSGSTMTPFPHPAHRSGHADFPHPACMGLSLSREHHAIFVVLCHSILLLALVWGLYGAFFVKGASRHFCRPLSFHSFV